MKTEVRLILVLLGALPALVHCECGETRVDPDQALISHYYVGNGPEVQPFDRYGASTAGADPEQAEVEVDFGSIDLGTQAQRYLFIRNTGDAVLNLVGLAWESGPGPFAVACLDGGEFKVGCDYDETSYLRVAPGADLVIQLLYAPGAVQADEAAFVLTTNAEDFPRFRVALRGQGVTPEIQVCVHDCTGAGDDPTCTGAALLCNDAVEPANLSLPFGDANAGASLVRQVIVRNIGDQTLTISGLQIRTGDAGQFGWTAPGGVLPGPLAPGAEVLLEVTYHPTTGGEHESSLQILSNDTNEAELNVTLSGRGLAPRVCPEPLSLDFGTVAVGEPEERSFKIRNCGLLPLELQSVALATDPNQSPDFSLVEPPTAAVTLQPEEEISIRVLYSPGEAGSDTGGVDIFSDDPSSDPVSHFTGTVALTGRGMVRECNMQATPFTLNFGGVVSGLSDTMILLLSNQGNDTCRFDGAEITTNSNDNEFSVLASPTAGATFAPGDILQIEIQYAPTAIEVDHGVLTISGNDRDGPTFDVPLVGEGVATAECEVTIVPDVLRFGTAKLNTTHVQYLTIQNQGNAQCNITEVRLRNSILMPSDYTLTSAPTTPFVLARRGQNGDRRDVEVTFAPDQLGYHSGSIWIEADDPELQLQGGTLLDSFVCTWPAPPEPGQACIPLSGNAAESDIEVVPSELDFGVVTVGCNSPELSVNVYNLGSYELNVSDIYLEAQDGNFEIRQMPTTPFVLAGGGRFQVRLRYHPQDLNPHRNALYIVSDASNEDMLIVPLFGRGTNISTATDTFTQPTEVMSDVLFVVDNSGSMGWAQSELASNFSSFIGWAVSLEVDYHIGVIATEVNEAETDQGDPGRDIIPGVLIQAPGRPKIITNGTPNVQDAFVDNVSIGTCCSDEQEAGLEAAWMALSEPLVSDPAANAGFLRDMAKLYIVCLSDEQDQSKGDPDFYVDFFRSIKGPRNTAMMKVSAIVGDEPDGCGTDTAGSGSRYIEVQRQTGGIFESICTSNWSQALEHLGFDAFEAIREFPLSRPADESTITVTVNGVPVPKASSTGGADGWTFYPDSNTIYFGDGVVPERGDEISISYTAVCL